MEKLFIVRAGKTDGSGNLTTDGIKELKTLFGKLLPEIGRHSVFILTATSPGSIGTAQLFAQSFGADSHDYQESPLLWTGRSGVADATPEDFDTIFKIITRRRSERHIIMVVEEEYAIGFPNYFGRNHLEAHLRGGSIPPGNVWVIDCPDKSIRHIKPDPLPQRRPKLQPTN